MEIAETVASTDDACFACDPTGRILAWNDGAKRLLGYTGQDVIGKACFEIVEGRDLFGNRFCHERCAFRSMADRHEPVHHCELEVRTASATRTRVLVSVFFVSDRRPADYVTLHLLEACPDTPSKEQRGNPGNPGPETTSPSTSSLEPLTLRETEVLRMLAAGALTREIADRLSISEATVRNHVHHILRKLHAHTRLQAVGKAIREHLL